MRVILPILGLFLSVESARILIYNSGIGHSHMRFTSTLGDILVEAGHHVTEIQPKIDPSLKFDSRADRDILSYDADELVKELYADSRVAGGFLKRIWYEDMGPVSMMKQGENLTRIMIKTCEHLIQRTDLVETLRRREEFDIGISEAFDTCGHGILAAIGLKTVISTATMNMLDHHAILMGVPRVPSYVPGSMAISFGSMSLSGRVTNVIGSQLTALFFFGVTDEQTGIFKKKFGDQFPSIRDIVSESAIMFTNSNPFIDFPAPTMHRIVSIGGIHIKETGEVDREWDSILNKKSQTVLISFGSVAKSVEMPSSYKRSILKVISEMPDVQFIWKYEGDDLMRRLPENLLLTKWMPQSALLADKRLSLFITHGGLASTTEIAYSGVPAIVVPLFADQARNGMTLVRQGVAKLFDKYDLADSQKLESVIDSMIREKGYGEKASRLSELLKSAPFSPKELVLKNVDFIARFGSLPELDPYGRHLSYIEYFLLDIIGLSLIIILSILIVIIWIVRRIFSKIFGSRKEKRD